MEILTNGTRYWKLRVGLIEMNVVEPDKRTSSIVIVENECGHLFR